MQILSTLAVGAVVVLHMSTAQTPATSEPVLVTSVVDGGAIEVQAVGRVRLLGIAAPKLDRKGSASAPFAVDARDRLSSLVASRWVRLQYEAGASSAAPGRSAYVLLDDGDCVNEVLVREGLARVTARASSSRFAALQRAQEEAQRQQRGIWSPLASGATETYKMKQSSRPKTKRRKKGGGDAGSRRGGAGSARRALGRSAAAAGSGREAVCGGRTHSASARGGRLPDIGCA